jgi:hypothetical protein
MSASRKSLYGLAAVLSLSVLASGCGGGLGLSGAKHAVLGRGATDRSPNIPERPKLAMPAPGAPLPVPGEAAPARTQWTATVQQPNQQAAASTQPERESQGSWYSGITGVFTR